MEAVLCCLFATFFQELGLDAETVTDWQRFAGIEYSNMVDGEADGNR